jgi:hypothetical protein
MRENRETPGAPAGSRAGRRENATSDESIMNAHWESHDCVVPTKAPNKCLQRSAEGPEGMRSIEEIPKAWADAGHSAREHRCNIMPKEWVQAEGQVRAYL